MAKRLALIGHCLATAAQAQTYPARPITIEVTTAAGGLTDPDEFAGSRSTGCPLSRA